MHSVVTRKMKEIKSGWTEKEQLEVREATSSDSQEKHK